MTDTSMLSPADYIRRFETALETVSAFLYPEEINVHKAAAYALASGGKRVRPLICLQAAAAAGSGDDRIEVAIPAALAVEMIHTYSLIHDDLPCMDNDDLRRGQPTVHKVFGDDIALLAGDALLTDAFTVLTSKEIHRALNATSPEPAHMLMQVQLLSQAAGGQGMVLGQACDLFWTARSGASKDDLDHIHLHKTGKLLGSAAALGAAAAGMGPEVVNKFKEFGELTGLAFQIIDDLLDSEGGTGKSVGKDAEAGKLTYATTMAKSASEKAAADYTTQALGNIRSTGLNTSELEKTVNTLLSRSK